jgi:pimeloyl-ACP methyl ester carboxylesterase
VLLAPGATVLRLAPGFFVRLMFLLLLMRALGRSPLRRTCGWLFEDAVRGDASCRARVERALDDLERVVRVFALQPPPWPRVLSDAEWRTIRVPCLFLVGEHEKIYSAKAAVLRLERVAPQVKAEIIPGTGHDLMLVNPDLLAGKVLEFLAEREGTSAPAAGQIRPVLTTA